jgi:hypothetical protein
VRSPAAPIPAGVSGWSRGRAAAGR